MQSPFSVSVFSLWCYITVASYNFITFILIVKKYFWTKFYSYLSSVITEGNKILYQVRRISSLVVLV